MVNQEIVNYLQEGLKRGFSLSLLQQKLLEGGFELSDIIDAISTLPSPTQTPIISELQEPQQLQQPLQSQQTLVPQEPAQPQEHLSVFSRIESSLRAPRFLFEHIRDESALRTLRYHETVMLIPFVLTCIVLFSFIAAVSLDARVISPWFMEMSSWSSGMFVVAIALAYLVFIPLCAFIWSGVLHVFVKLLQGTGGFTQTYKSVIYSGTPKLLWVSFAVLLFALPYAYIATAILTVFVVFWSFFTTGTGLVIYHTISQKKAALALTLTFLIGAALTGVVLLIS